jgi:tRNA dimethylallyltransferase
MNSQPKILAIVGPTASGKSELAVRLAKKFNGEIISCDSRQIYKGMNLGTGKVEGSWTTLQMRGRAFQQFVYKKVPHHLIDFQNPKKQFSVAQFQNQAKKTAVEIVKRDHLPILCGGTMHWMDAVVFRQVLPDVKPNYKLRKQLEAKSARSLFARIRTLDPVRAKSIDPNNKRRLIRALEIILTTGKPVPLLHASSSMFNVLWLGVKRPQTDLYKKIDRRLKQRLEAGMIEEVKKLKKSGLSWKRLEDFGLEYRFVSQYLQKKLTFEEMFTQLSYAIKHYSKRQMTWWKRNKEINWIEPDAKTASRLVAKFLS